jgi:hypothetical protein
VLVRLSSGSVRLPKVVAAVLVAIILAGWGLGPSSPQSLVGTLGWSAVVYSVLFGLGAAARRRLGISMMLGETLLVGAGVWIFAVGLLLAVGMASRIPLFAVAAAGSLWAIAELVLAALAPPPASREGRGFPGGLDRTALLLLVLFAGYFLLNLAGSLSTRGNPGDDGVAYGGFVRRLLDCGDLVEPFSFRRISAYGGQTALLALSALRGDYESFDLTDRGLFQPLVALLLLELARRRRLHTAASLLLVTFVVAQMENRFNSASHWTGIATFLAAYGFASREDLSPRARLIGLYAMCGVACTLRQNFIMAAGLFAVLATVFHLRAEAAAVAGGWRAALRDQKSTLLWAVGCTAAIVLPYMVAAWHSNHTFLYPVLLGTGNPVAPLRPIGATVYDELVFFAAVFLNSEPVRPWWVLAPLMLMARDLRPGKPFTALLWASLLGFVYLTHSFMLSDAYNIWRYAAGYMTPLMAVFLAELLVRLPLVGADAGAPGDEPKLRLPVLATAIILFVLLLQLVESRGMVAGRIAENSREVAAVRVLGTSRTGLRERHYRSMQQSIPAGDAAGGVVAALVDEAMWLDYRRNRIVNLDLPGFAAPAPGLPSFLPIEVWRSYFHSQGIRYLVYVDGSYSQYLFRRKIWAEATFSDHGIWRFMATHMVDIIDAMSGLAARSKVLYREDGFVALDLGPVQPVDAAALRAHYRVPELLREQTWLRRQLADELDGRLWDLMTRHDVAFDNVEPIEYAPPVKGLAQLLGFPGKPGEPPRRWLSDRTHVRVLGQGRHRLQVQLTIDIRRLGTRPTVSLSLDGQELFLSRPTLDGKVDIDVLAECRGWCDVYLNVSTVGVTWQAASATRGIRLDALRWLPEHEDRGIGGAGTAAGGRLSRDGRQGAP